MKVKLDIPSEGELIKTILTQTHSLYGKEFFRALVKHLAESLKVKGAWVTKLLITENRLQSLAFWLNGKYVETYEYDLANTPCEQVVTKKSCLVVSSNVVKLYPKDPDLPPLGAVSYLGYPLLEEHGEVIGHLAVLDDKPLYPSELQEALFNLFLQRANGELIRLEYVDRLQEKKKRLASLIDNMQEAILELDAWGFVRMSNPAASRLFGIEPSAFTGLLALGLFEQETTRLLRDCLKAIREKNVLPPQDETNGESHIIGKSGSPHPVSISLSHYSIKDETYLTIILKDLKPLKRAESRIKILEDEICHLHFLDGEKVIGESPAILQVFEQIKLLSKSDATVLLQGESGTGKEVMARLIHQSSLRASMPFVVANCAAIPANLMESEFFGHEKGAFTGALQRREGRFSIADGGTLFLDEIGELPLELQPKLLRALQEGEFEPLGGSKTIKVDVRIIAATNRDLATMVEEGGFREDLFYRLCVIPITLPPLRNREKDVVLLADQYMKIYCKKLGKKMRPLHQQQIELLLAYDWPGNVRELQHIMERAVILSPGEEIELEKFIPFRGEAEKLVQHQLPSKILTQQELMLLEKENLLKALAHCNGKISGKTGAANLLGIPPTTLHSKIKAFGLQ
jgi:PAS domain S-box-containing protein